MQEEFKDATGGEVIPESEPAWPFFALSELRSRSACAEIALRSAFLYSADILCGGCVFGGSGCVDVMGFGAVEVGSVDAN
jgi:hypothetical protein